MPRPLVGRLEIRIRRPSGVAVIAVARHVGIAAVAAKRDDSLDLSVRTCRLARATHIERKRVFLARQKLHRHRVQHRRAQVYARVASGPRLQQKCARPLDSPFHDFVSAVTAAAPPDVCPVVETFLEARVAKLVARRGKRKVYAVEERKVESVHGREPVDVLLLARRLAEVYEDTPLQGLRGVDEYFPVRVALDDVICAFDYAGRPRRKTRDPCARLHALAHENRPVLELPDDSFAARNDIFVGTCAKRLAAKVDLRPAAVVVGRSDDHADLVAAAVPYDFHLTRPPGLPHDE